MISKFNHFFISIFFCVSIGGATLYAQDSLQDTIVFREAEVVVLSGKTPAATPLISRTIDIIKPDQLGYVLSSSTHDLLQSIVGLDAQSRGPAGVQMDISMRGGSFEQTLILVDGIPIRDPQTGHHALNLPFDANLIEQVEVLKGPGSRSFGANALSGVVQFITRAKPAHKLRASIGGGQYGMFETSLSGGANFGWHNHTLSFARSQSDGYRQNTDFKNTSVSYSGNIRLGTNKFYGFIGNNEKAFGANGFYTSRFPNQFEKTRTLLVHVRGEIPTGSGVINPQLYYRRHKDDFVLKRENPDFYHNIHKTEVLGAEIHGLLESTLGTSKASAKGSLDRIASTNLGNHKRHEIGFSFEHLVHIGNKLRISVGTYTHNYNDRGWGFSPGADASYAISDVHKIFLSAATSFRMPTYTELYYSDPVQSGSANLEPERGAAYELGWRMDIENFRISAAIFQHNLRNGIDWVKYNEADAKAVATNLAKITSEGAEISISYIPNSSNNLFRITHLRIEYTYIEARKSVPVFESRYLLTHLRNHGVISGIHNIFPQMNFTWTLKHYERSTTGSATLLDAAGSYKIGFAEISVLAGNIFNTPYAHFPSVPLPGRWITGKLTLTVD